MSAPSPITAAIRLGFDVISLSPQGAGLDQAANLSVSVRRVADGRRDSADIFGRRRWVLVVSSSANSRVLQQQRCWRSCVCVCARASLGTGSVSESLHGVRGTEVTLTVAQERYAANIYT